MKQLILFLLFFQLNIYAKSTTETLGDIFQVAIPLGAYGTTLYEDDKEGEYQFYKAYATTLGSTFLLKYTLQEPRPDSDNTDSFPSGHTSSAFSGASFIHMRYGWKNAIIPYLAATYTGYSRIASEKHYLHDVLAGAAIGVFSSWYFVSPYKNLKVSAQYSSDFKGLCLNYRW